MVNLILSGFAGLIGYVVVCAVHPIHRCPRCKGTRIEAVGVRCRRCKGHGRAHRRGARLVHRMIWENIGPWLKRKVSDAAERRREAAR
jgi:hypothetical protein